MARGEHQIKIRFPDEVVEAIRASAKANGRSMNAEIVSLLKSGGIGEAAGGAQRHAQHVDENPMGLVWEVQNISKLVGLTERQTFHILSNGEIPARKIGGKWVVQKDELRKFFAVKAGV